MRYFTACLVLVTHVAWATADLAAGGVGVQVVVLEAGEFHGDEVTARSGETWLGLFPTAHGLTLRPTRLHVSAVYDPVADDPPARTGKSVRAGGATVPLFFVKSSRLAGRPTVATAFAGSLALGNAAYVELSLGRHGYSLSVGSDSLIPSVELRQRSTLRLTDEGGRSQVVFSMQENNEGHWTLLWAGDLDGDGKLDLYMDLSNHYNVSDRILFLSSLAKKGALVGLAGSFRTVGC